MWMEMGEIVATKNMKQLFICFILFQNLTTSYMPLKYWACIFLIKIIHSSIIISVWLFFNYFFINFIFLLKTFMQVVMEGAFILTFLNDIVIKHIFSKVFNFVSPKFWKKQNPISRIQMSWKLINGTICKILGT